MASRGSYSCRLMVLRKTKLGEADVVVTCLAQDGSQVRAVAKGARKPQSSLSSRLEQFAVADCQLARGRNLDVVTEARAVNLHAGLRADVEAVLAASPIAELLVRTTQVQLPVERLFDMADAALGALEVSRDQAKTPLAAAALLKTAALLGFRPNFSSCVSCGLLTDDMPQEGKRAFSHRDGGVVCRTCATSLERVTVDVAVLDWAHALMMSTFAQVSQFDIDAHLSLLLLQFVMAYLRENMGVNLTSMSYLIAGY